MNALTVVTKSADHTRELAAALAPLLEPRDTILLAGDLGAGKTTFTQGLGRALGVEQPITSPTFTLMHQYPTATVPLVHADVYRVGRLHEIVDLGLGEMIDDGAIAVIEWGDLAAPTLPPDFLELRIGFGAGDDERTITLRPVGLRWAARLDAVERALEAWSL